MLVTIIVAGKGAIESLTYNGEELVTGGNRCTGLLFQIEGKNAPVLKPDLRPPVPPRDPREHPKTPRPGPRIEPKKREEKASAEES